MASTRRLRLADDDDDDDERRLECPKRPEFSEVDGRKAATGARAVIDAIVSLG